MTHTVRVSILAWLPFRALVGPPLSQAELRAQTPVQGRQHLSASPAYMRLLTCVSSPLCPVCVYCLLLCVCALEWQRRDDEKARRAARHGGRAMRGPCDGSTHGIAENTARNWMKTWYLSYVCIALPRVLCVASNQPCPFCVSARVTDSLRCARSQCLLSRERVQYDTQPPTCRYDRTRVTLRNPPSAPPPALRSRVRAPHRPLLSPFRSIFVRSVTQAHRRQHRHTRASRAFG